MMIYSQAELDTCIEEAIAKMAALNDPEPLDRACHTIQLQLEAFQGWLAEGNTAMSADDKERYTMGLVAQRELRSIDPPLSDLVVAVHNYLIEDIPIDG